MHSHIYPILYVSSKVIYRIFFVIYRNYDMLAYNPRKSLMLFYV